MKLYAEALLGLLGLIMLVIGFAQIFSPGFLKWRANMYSNITNNKNPKISKTGNYFGGTMLIIGGLALLFLAAKVYFLTT